MATWTICATKSAGRWVQTEPSLSRPLTLNVLALLLQTSTTGYKRPVVSKCKSVQGEWHERMDLVSLDLKVTMK